jgi:hypothetical protein
MHLSEIYRFPLSVMHFPERSNLHERRAQARRRYPFAQSHSAPVALLKDLYKFMSLLQDEKESSRRSVRRQNSRRRSSVKAGSISGSFRKDGSLKNSFTSDDYQATLKRSMIQKHMRQASVLSINTNVSIRSIFQNFSTQQLLLILPYRSQGARCVTKQF